MYAGSNDGVLVRDAIESDDGIEQTFKQPGEGHEQPAAPRDHVPSVGRSTELPLE
jgi:hypothetical protein